MGNMEIVVADGGQHRTAATGDTLVDPEGLPLQGNPTNKAALSFIFNGGVLEIPLGPQGELTVPFNCTILNVTITASTGGPGDLQLDIRKSDFAGYPGSLASITAASRPALTAADKYYDDVLTGWDTSVAEGDILQFVVDSVSSIQQATINLVVEKTV